MFSTSPPEAAEKEQVDAFELNVEAVAALEPDLVILAFDPGDAVAGFEALDIPVLLFDAPTDLDGAYSQWEVLGAATGRVAEAASLVAETSTSIDRAVEEVPTAEHPATYFYELDPTLYTATSGTFIGSLFTQFGMENIADPADPDGTGFPQLSPEAVIEADPDLIYLADTQCCQQNAAAVAERPGWDTLGAVERGDIVELPDDVAQRWGPSVVELVEMIASSLERHLECCRLSTGPASGRGEVVARPVRLPWQALALALLALAAAALAGLVLGPAALPPGDVIRELLDALPFVNIESALDARQTAILWELRAPRVVLGGLVGATLATAGAAYQGVFRNPLADPYLLGVAAGAGLGATIALVADAAPGLVAPAAFCGAVVAVVLATSLARTAGTTRTPATLILAGVAVAAFLTAVQTFLQQQRSDSIREVYSWILGRLSTVGWSEVWQVMPYVVVTWLAITVGRRLLDVLAVGDHEAATLGIRPNRVRVVMVVAATLGTAAVVAVSGLIGFVGFVVPHTVRLLVGTSYRVIVPLSLVLGAAFLILADLAARTVVAPGELPIGVVTAFIGAPFFASGAVGGPWGRVVIPDAACRRGTCRL